MGSEFFLRARGILTATPFEPGAFMAMSRKLSKMTLTESPATKPTAHGRLHAGFL